MRSSHVGYDNKLYNGYSTDEVSTRFGARQLAVDAMTDRIVGRGVLLDIARLHGVDWLDGGTADHARQIWRPPSDAQGVTVGEGDFLLVRTGWRAKLLAEGRDGWMSDRTRVGHRLRPVAARARRGRGRFGQLGYRGHAQRQRR